MLCRLAALVVLLALLGGCYGTDHPRAMRDRRSGPGTESGGAAAGGGGGGGGTVSDPVPAPVDESPPPPRSGPSAPPASDCEELGQCCASMTGDDEAACIAVLQGYDEPRCREGTYRFCTFAQICDDYGCSSFGLGR